MESPKLMRIQALLPILLLCAVIAASCVSNGGGGGGSSPWQARLGAAGPDITPLGLLQQEIRLTPRLIPKGTVGRSWHRPMNPRYNTIHSTQNYTGDAFAHSKALNGGKLRATRRV